VRVTLKGCTQRPNEKDLFPELSQLFLYLSVLKYLLAKTGNKKYVLVTSRGWKKNQQGDQRFGFY